MLGVPDENGNTLADSIELTERKLGRSVREDVPLPACGEHLWEWYVQLKSSGERLSYAEIRAWVELTGIEIYPEEISALLAMDLARENWFSERKKREHST